MKKKLLLLLLVLFVIFCFAGCKKDINDKPIIENEQRQEVPITPPTPDPGRVK